MERTQNVIILRKKKFIRNVIIGFVSLAAVAYILNISPGYKKDLLESKINLIINDTNKKEEIQNDIIISEKENIYLSLEDINYLFKRIYLRRGK